MDHRPGGETAEQENRRVRLRLTGSIVLANVIGAVVVVTLVLVVIPGDPILIGRLVWVNAVVLPVYVAAALVVGVVGGSRLGLSSLAWAFGDEEPGERDVAATLAVPARLTVLQGGLWLLALALFGSLFAAFDPQNTARVAFPIAYGGVVVCANAYLVGEYALRPIAARALVGGPVGDRRAVGVRGRTVLAWALGSGVPVAGTMTVAIFALLRGDVSAARIEVTVLVLGAVTLVFGLLLTVLSSNAVVAPLRTVRAGMSGVERGDLGTRIVVFDGTELGELQAGFNLMAGGLAERERLRDLFGRQVGRDVASAALASPPELGGEERDVAVLFVDLVGSTGLAENRPPAEVVRLLNRFFSVVVDEVEEHGGFVNKFQGDGALAVFGAPLASADPAGAALATARAIVTRLRTEVPECEVGMGVAAGAAVAGNVGDERRFEYTVIGDPVNSAARLADLAKQKPGGLLAALSAVEAAEADEAAHWCPDGEKTLRGRSQPTALARPRDA